MIETLMQELNKARIPARNGWLVAAQGWKDYLCVEDCCTGLAPLEAITDSVLNAELTFRGSSYEKGVAARIPAWNGTAATEQAVTDAASLFSVGDPNDATAEPMRTAPDVYGRTLLGECPTVPSWNRVDARAGAADRAVGSRCRGAPGAAADSFGLDQLE